MWTPQIVLLYAGVTLRRSATTAVGALAFVYMASFGISSETMGIVTAINPAIAVAGTLVFGAVIDRVNRNAAILFGFAVGVLYPFLYSFASTPLWFAIAAVPLGLSFAAYYSGSTTHIGAIVPPTHQGAMFGLLDSFRGLGGLIGPILGGGLVTAYGYRPMFLTMTGIAAAGLLLAWIGVRLGARPSTGTPAASDAA